MKICLLTLFPKGMLALALEVDTIFIELEIALSNWTDCYNFSNTQKNQRNQKQTWRHISILRQPCSLFMTEISIQYTLSSDAKGTSIHTSTFFEKTNLEKQSVLII